MICTENNQVREDSTSETRRTDTRFKYSVDGPQHPSGLDAMAHFNELCGFIDECPYSDLYGRLLQVVQRHFCNKYCETTNYKKTCKPACSDPTAVLDGMTAVVENVENVGRVQNGPAEPHICRFGYPLPLNTTGTCLKVREYLLEYDVEGNPSFAYELRMNSLRNDRWVNLHMRGLVELWRANIDFQLVVDIDKVITYMTKYVTKPEIEMSSNMNKMILQVINKSHHDGLTTKAI